MKKLPTKLKNLKKNGKLKKVLRIIKKTKLKTIGQGAQAIAFKNKKKKKIVYKLVPIKIKYFKSFPTDDVYDMKDKIKLLRLFFLRIRKIKYNDSNVFFYTQSYGEKTNVTPYFILSIFQLLIAMISYNFIVEDISSHNISIYKGNILSFDFHGMITLNISDGKIDNNNWHLRILKKILVYSDKLNIPQNNIINCFNTNEQSLIISRLHNVYRNIYNIYYDGFTETEKKYITLKDNFIGSL